MVQRTIWTAPAGSGKTTQAVKAIIQAKMLRPWDTVWVLLPTTLQMSAFRDSLLDHYASQGEEVYFGVQFFEFYKLYSHLLDLFHVPQKSIDQSSVFRILRQLIATPAIQEQLTYFTPIADKPGFIDVVAGFINELKQAHVPPEDFGHYAKASSKAKNHDIAIIYQAYQAFLRTNDLVDREGAGWLALATLEANDVHLAGVNMLVVDGFTQFSPLQTRLLNELTNYIPKTILTLTHEDVRATTIHRSLDRTLRRLQDEKGAEWEITPLTVKNTWQKPELVYLEEHFMSATAPPIAAGDALQLIEAPNRENEVRMVLRDIKQKLLTGTAPDEIVILTRDMAAYGDILRSVASRYGLPIMFREGLTLTQNPAVSALLDLLRLHDVRTENYRRQAVMDILRTPYFKSPFNEEDINALERISLKYRVVNGRKKWEDAVELALHKQAQDTEARPEDFILDEELAMPIIPPTDEGLWERLQNFFDSIHPPTNARPYEYVEWIENLIGLDPYYLDTTLSEEELNALPSPTDFGFYEQVRQEVVLGDVAIVQEASESVITRDLRALKALRTALRGLMAAYELLDQAGEDIHLSWQEFFADMERTLKVHKVDLGGNDYRSGHVLATTVFDARGLPHKYVFILGLSEGQFPTQRNEDPLYSDREREAFNQAGIQVTATTLEEDDTSIFYTCAAMAQECLTLSRPTIDDKANVWPSSILWQATTSLLTDAPLQRMRAGEPTHYTQAADFREFGVGLANALYGEDSRSAPTAEVELLASWLAAHPSESYHWENAHSGREVESQRRAIFNQYSGLLQNESLLNKTAQLLGSRRMWSASQFNDYGYCAFRFFAKRLLLLEEFEEPQEGMDNLQLGSLQHAILEYTYRRFKTSEIEIHPDNLSQALDILRTHAHDVFASAPAKYEFRASSVWQKEKEEILNRLIEFVQRDFTGHEKSPFSEVNLAKKLKLSDDTLAQARFVYAVESPFGLDDQPPAHVDGTAGELLTVGLIDRIDRIGNKLIIVDYKSGTNLPNEKEMARGRNFQMMVYLLAARQIIEREAPDLEVVGGVFWSLSRPDKSEVVPIDHDLLTELQMTLHHYVEAARLGDFSVQPNQMEAGKCYKFCEYSHLCRFVRSDLFKER